MADKQTMRVTARPPLHLLPLACVLHACFSPTPAAPGGGDEDGSSSSSGAQSPSSSTNGETTTGLTDDGASSSSSSSESTGADPECTVENPCPEGQYCVADSCENPPDGMAAVPAGTFWMGCNEDLDLECSPDEYPYHEVFLDAFAIDRLEVSRADYAACVADGQCSSPEPLYPTGQPCSPFPGGNHPINCVDWFAAKIYCEAHGKRLPSEAEWEKAARGTDGRLYPWGNESPTCNEATFSGCGGTLPVGSLPAGASPYGALDMAGNVFEWTADWYGASYYVESPDQNPLGPVAGTRRAIRSGADNYGAAAQRASARGPDWEAPTPDDFSQSVGFRCALTPG